MTEPKTSQGDFEEILARINGQEPDEYRREKAERASLWEEAQSYLNLPPSAWPELHFNWDLSYDGFRFALDGLKPQEFARIYPQGLVIGWTSLVEFDAKLCHFSRRDGDKELWQLGSPISLAQVIAHVRRGRPITPPLVEVNDENEFCLRGGHHRYAVAKAVSLIDLPILAEPNDCSRLSSIARIRWVNE